MKARIEKSSFRFLSDLKKNNDREWFNAHKERYLREHEILISFSDALLNEMNKHDVIETPSGRKSLHRIYRDIRFSKDKTPYNAHWGGGFRREGKQRRGSYYFHLSPGGSFAAGGFWGPNSEDLKRIREEFSRDPGTIKTILENKKFKSFFGPLQGEKVKTTPKGFNSADEAIDLIRHKQFLLVKKFTDTEVMASDFVKKLNDTFRNMRPFLDYMSEVLTTNSNGESLL